MKLVNNFTLPKYLGKLLYTQKCVNRDITKLASKQRQRKCFQRFSIVIFSFLNEVSCQVNREDLTLDNPLWRWDCCVTTNPEIFLYLIIITIVIVIVAVIIIFTRPYATFWGVSFRLRRSARIGYCCLNVGTLSEGTFKVGRVYQNLKT